EGETRFLRRLLFQRGRRDGGFTVRREPRRATFEQTVRHAGRVEEGHVDVRIHGVQEHDQIDAVVQVPEDALHALAHGVPRAVADRGKLQVRRREVFYPQSRCAVRWRNVATAAWRGGSQVDARRP